MACSSSSSSSSSSSLSSSSSSSSSSYHPQLSTNFFPNGFFHVTCSSTKIACKMGRLHMNFSAPPFKAPRLHPMAIRWRNLAHSQIDELWRFVAHTGGKWDGTEIGRKNQVRLVIHLPLFTTGFQKHPNGGAGFLKHEQYGINLFLSFFLSCLLSFFLSFFPPLSLSLNIYIFRLPNRWELGW